MKLVIYSSIQMEFAVVTLKNRGINSIRIMQMFAERQRQIIQSVKSMLFYVPGHCSERTQFIIQKQPKKTSPIHLRLESGLAHIQNELFHLAFCALNVVRHLKHGQNVIRQCTLHFASQLATVHVR